MLPNKEVQELARAIINTTEYMKMKICRRKILNNALLARQMQLFEKEQNHLISSNLSAKALSEQLNKLYAEYKDFLAEKDVKELLNAMDQCQKMIDNCFIMLNKALNIHSN